MKGVEIIGLLVLLFIAVLWGAWVLTVLWAWFIVPTFDAPRLTMTAAIGVSLVVSYMVPTPDPSDDNLIEAAIKVFLKPAIALAFGWIVTLFM